MPDKFTEQGERVYRQFSSPGVVHATAIEQRDFGVIAEIIDLEGESTQRILRALNNREEMLAAMKYMLESWDCRHPEAGIVAIRAATAKAEAK